MSELQAFETVSGRSPKQAPIPLRVGAIDIFACISASAKNQTVFDVQRRDIKSVQDFIDRKAEGKILKYDRNANMIALSTCQDIESVERTVVFATIK